jgi:signal transduction histidine kinase
MTFDIQTTILMIFLVYVILHGAIWVVLGGEKSRQVTIWCASGIISGLAVILFANQPSLPAFVFYYVAQILMIIGNFGRIYALRTYLDEPQGIYYKANIVVNVLYFCISIGMYETGYSLEDLLKVFFGFWIIGCLDYVIAGYQIYKKKNYYGGLIAMYAGIILCITLGQRALGMIMGWGAMGIYEQSWDQGIMILGQILGITLSNIGFLQIFMTIREQKKIEIQSDLVKEQEKTAYLSKYGDELKTLIQEREEMIRQLTLSNKSAGMGALVASIAHELNQPLAAMRLNAQLMEMKLSDVKLDQKEGRTMIEAVLNDNVRASEIIRKLRNMFGNPEANKFQLINLGQMVEDTIDLIRAKARDENIEVEAKISQNIEIVGEATQLQQVVLNLLNNGLEALLESSKQNKKLSVELMKNGANIVLRVKDNGMGIPESIKKSLFELFKTSKAEGMGVGLWLSQAVAKNHQGQITCESISGEGATFELLLPANKGLDKNLK